MSSSCSLVCSSTRHALKEAAADRRAVDELAQRRRQPLHCLPGGGGWPAGRDCRPGGGAHRQHLGHARLRRGVQQQREQVGLLDANAVCGDAGVRPATVSAAPASQRVLTQNVAAISCHFWTQTARIAAAHPTPTGTPACVLRSWEPCVAEIFAQSRLAQVFSASTFA